MVTFIKRLSRQHCAMRRTLLYSLIFYFCLIAEVATASSVQILVNEGVHATQFTPTDIRQIFVGHRQYWPDGKRIRVFVLEDNSDLHKAFCREALHIFPYQLSRIWDQMTYSGQGVPPTRVSSPQALIDAIETTDGAIGYVSANRGKGMQIAEDET